jgi:hypothetical protein
MSFVDPLDIQPAATTHFGRPGHKLCEGQESILQGVPSPVTSFTTHRGFVNCPDCLRLMKGATDDA